MFKKTVALIIISTFMYSNIIYANGLDGMSFQEAGNEQINCKLAVDGAEQLELLQRLTAPEGLGGMVKLAKEVGNGRVTIPKNGVKVSKLKRSITENDKVTDLLDLFPDNMVLQYSSGSLYFIMGDNVARLIINEGREDEIYEDAYIVYKNKIKKKT